MNIKAILVNTMLLVALVGVGGCGHMETSARPDEVTVQSFGCGGDVPSPYAPYCHPRH